MEGIVYPLVVGGLLFFGLIGTVVWHQSRGKSGTARAGAALKLVLFIFGLGVWGIFSLVVIGLLWYVFNG